MPNKLGTTIHHGDNVLILRLKTMLPAQLHSDLLKGLIVAQKLALQAEDLTKEEKLALEALNEILFQLMPSAKVCEIVMERVGKEKDKEALN